MATAARDKQILYLSTLTFYPAKRKGAQEGKIQQKKEVKTQETVRGSKVQQQNEGQTDDKRPLLHEAKFLTRWRNVRFILFIIINFFIGISYSLLYPIYPIEAEKKGISLSIYGFVFGAYPLTTFVFAPIYGRFIPNIGAKFMLSAGVCVMAICLVLFGLLSMSSNSQAFIILSFTVIIVEGLGNAAFITACYSACAQVFEDTPGTFAYLQSAFTAGLIIGPTFGGYFYELGNFILPFAIIGCLIFVSGIVTIFVLPEIEVEKVNKSGFSRLLRKPSILVSCFSFLIINFTVGFVASTLELHVRRFHVRPVLLGLLFIISGIVCVVTNRLWGFFARSKNLKLLSGEGALIIIVAFCFFGPAPFLPFNPSLWVIALTLAIFGIGIGGELLIPFLDAIDEAIRMGYPDNLETYGMVAGLWSSSSALGQFLGPSLAGLLLDSIGYSYATLLVIILHCIVAVLFFGFYIYEKRHQTAETDNTMVEVK